MSYESEEKATFNRALKKTEETSKKILDTYRRSLKATKEEIAKYELLKISDPFTPLRAAELRRLENLHSNLKGIINELYAEQYKITKQGFVHNWTDTYYATGFNLNKEINKIEKGFDVALNYRQLNKRFVANIFDRKVDGRTYLSRISRNKTDLLFKVQDQTASALVEGISIKDLAKRLKKIDEVYASNMNKALLTASQELMTAYSFGQEDAIRVAVNDGVEGEFIWRSTLDSRTRTPKTSNPPNHKKMDGQKKDDVDGLYTFPVSGETIRAPRIRGKGNAGLNQIMRCRCRSLFLPFGILPTKRLAKSKDGVWGEINGDLSYTQWRETLQTPRSFKGEAAYRRKRDESN